MELLMGNEAIALGAVRAGVRFVSGYPGTPSTETLETVAKNNDAGIYVEWSVNEKVALEAAAGAVYAGARSMVTMKQMGLNVAADAIMSLAYIGVKGGMVVVAADDPGPISSQTEQDTREFAAFARIPVFDPSSPEEAYEMMADAFYYSEKYETPVIIRPTTRVCHGCASVELKERLAVAAPEGFKKDNKWVIFPKTSYMSHMRIEERNPVIAADFSQYQANSLTGSGTMGIAAGGVSYEYAREALELLGNPECKLLKVGTPYPFPEQRALEFLDGLSSVLVIEELSPFIEDKLVYLCGKYAKNIKILGKRTGHTPRAGENSVETAVSAIASHLGLSVPQIKQDALPSLPVRPPVLCAGCPHRASFYAVKKAMKGKKAVFSGDIGCYTLGNAAPLNMVDTCLCMGAGITIAQGLHRIEPDAVNFAFVGDSTFFHTGIPGVINAVYNQTKIVLIVLDNSTTAMTGQQPHPGTGVTMMGKVSPKADIEAVLKAAGAGFVAKINPFEHDKAVEAVKRAAQADGVSAVIFEAPCIAVGTSMPPAEVDPAACTGCKKCANELGCPAIVLEGGKARVEKPMCTGCGLCGVVCPFGAIKRS